MLVFPWESRQQARERLTQLTGHQGWAIAAHQETEELKNLYRWHGRAGRCWSEKLSHFSLHLNIFVRVEGWCSLLARLGQQMCNTCRANHKWQITQLLGTTEDRLANSGHSRRGGQAHTHPDRLSTAVRGSGICGNTTPSHCNPGVMWRMSWWGTVLLGAKFSSRSEGTGDGPLPVEQEDRTEGWSHNGGRGALLSHTHRGTQLQSH